ncbi:MAG: DUF349 domain-containing protein [Bacteroidaceae bacterium]|nr:DUF349 domain-containing protein [Bacteroidaceae bacterium]
MTDIQNANEELQQEALAENSVVAEPTEETNETAAEVVAETEEAEVKADMDENKKNTASYQNKEEIIERLKQIAENNEEITRQELEALKSTFYRQLRQESEEAYNKYIEAGGAPEEYVPEANAEEVTFKELMAVIRDKRAAQALEMERQKEENYQKKLEIIEKIKGFLANPDEVNKAYNEFKTLQQEWNEIKNVPAEKATDLWKNYQLTVEQFYDTLKLNNELRAYDFKKNLELKTALCEKAEKLAEIEDVVSAFRLLQQYHQEFREIGPVSNELREEIWTRFKNASTVINKRHQDFFEKRKEQEEDNLAKKTALCETVEAFDLNSLKTFAEWNTVTDKVLELQAEWKTIGFAPQKMNVKIFERFRTACDNIFKQKSEFFKNVRDSLNENLRIKRELCEKAEALMDNTDWKETTDALVALQKQWKEVGTVPKKYSDAVWQRFNQACDKFFEAKKEANSSQRTEQLENLEKKKAIIAELEAIDPEKESGDYRNKLRKAQEDWNAVGHVPFKEKDKLFKLFRAQMDRLYGAFSESASKRRISRFKSEVKDNDGRIMERLNRQCEVLQNEIKTYENNLGFLSLSSKSKSGNNLVEELKRKMEKLRADLKETKEKIAALNEKKAQEE